jgi:molybdenum cofactor cytidylyltransferase
VVVVPEVGTPNPQPLGMGYSIAAGVSARPQASGWLVLPGDMPMVQTATLLAVAAALEHHPVAYAQHRGRRGHPVGFAGELYSELVTLSGDEGAKRLVARYPAHGVDVDDAGVLIDVDTEADLEKLRVAHASQPHAAPVAR